MEIYFLFFLRAGYVQYFHRPVTIDAVWVGL